MKDIIVFFPNWIILYVKCSNQKYTLFSILLPVFNDGMCHPTLGVDVFWYFEVFVSGQVWVGSMQEKEDKALEVVVGGTGGDGKARHAWQDPHDVLGVHPELAQQLDHLFYFIVSTGLLLRMNLDAGIEPALTHDGEWGAEVGLAAIRVSSGL